MSKSMQKIEKKLEILTQNAVIEKGTQPLLELGYVKGIRSLMKKARKALAASDRWQKVGPGAFCHNGNIRLALCAMLGPIYAIYFDGFSTRMRTVIIQRDNLNTACCYAVDIRKGIAPLCNALYLTSAEGKALEDMLATGSDLFGDIEHCLEWNSRDILPTKEAAKACSLSFSEEHLLDALEAVGQTGRELILAGLLNQLSVYFCP